MQQIIKIKESLKKNNTGTNYKAVRDILQKVDYNNEALEKDEWFLDLIIAKIRSDNHKPTFEFIMSIIQTARLTFIPMLQRTHLTVICISL